jgi:hypothetical protein
MADGFSEELCATIVNPCIDPKTKQPYVDPTIRCSVLNSGTPVDFLCKQFLGSEDAVKALSAKICAKEPSLPECKNAAGVGGGAMGILLILGIGLAVLVVVALLYQRSNQSY